MVLLRGAPRLWTVDRRHLGWCRAIHRGCGPTGGRWIVTGFATDVLQLRGHTEMGGLALYVGIATMRVCGNFAIYRIAQHGNAIFRAFSEAGRSGEINWRRRRDSTRVYSSSLVSLKNNDAGGVTGIHGGLLGGILLPRGPIDDPPRWDDRRHPQ